MSLIKKLAGETVIYGLGAILPKVLNFIILAPYFTREFGQLEYGKLGLLYAFVALVMVIVTFRMETAFFRFASKKENEIGITFSTSFISITIVTIISFFIMMLGADHIAQWLNIPHNPEFIRYFAWIILFDALAAPAFAKLRMENRPVFFSWIKIINVIVNVIVILFFLELCPYLYQTNPTYVSGFYHADMHLDYVFWSNLVASAVVLLMLTGTIFKDKFKFDYILFRQMFRYAIPLIVVGIAAVINNLSDRYFIIELSNGTLEENTAVSGIYNGSMKLAVLMSLFTTAFNYAAEPFFFKQASEANKDKVYAKVALAFSAIGSVIFLGVLFYIDIIQYMIGKDFRDALDVVPVLLMAYLLLGLFYNFAIWYKITDKTYVGAIIASIGSIIIIGLNYYLIPKIGYIGAAWSTLICYIFMTTAAYILGQRYNPFPYPIIKILLNLGLAVLLYFISIWIGNLLDGKVLLTVINTGMLIGYISFLYKYEWAYINSPS